MVGKVKKSINGSSTTTTANDRGQQVAQYLVAPWPEWSDADINAEKWDTKPAVQTEKQKAASISSASPDEGFESPLDRVCMPSSIPVHIWRRSALVDPGYKMLPVDVDAPDLDLVSTNGHILHSEVMRHIVTSIANLHHWAAIKPFDEVAGESFVPNGGRVWRPWNHVYSMCKAGKGTTHKPSTNKSGKYVVRLHFLGKWRRVTVDDILPLDELGRVLLPTTPDNELWPILLSKAILRVAALTWTQSNEVVEMHAVSCFTGWFMLNIECQRVPAKDVWLVCQKALMYDADEGARYKEEPKPTDAYHIGLTMGGGDRRDPLTYAACNAQEEGWGAVAVFADMADVEEPMEEELEEVGPCLGHQVMFTEARVIREGDDPGPLPLWKTFRWKKWALKTGIIQPDHLVNVKSLRVFAPLKKWVVPDEESLMDRLVEMKELQLAREIEDAERRVEAKKSKGGKKEKKEKKSVKGDKASKSKSKNKSSDKSGKSSGKKSDKSKTSKKESQGVGDKVKENTDPWMNFNVYSFYVKSVQLFFRASSFKYCRSTSDFLSFVVDSGKTETPKTEIKEKKPSKGKSSAASSLVAKSPQQRLVSTCKYKQRRVPDYFYVMSDTPTSNKMFITVSVVPPNAVAEQEALINQQPFERSDRPPFSLIVMNTNEALKASQSQCRSAVITVGTKSTMIQFGEGIVGLRMWVNLPPRHFIQIVSQADFRLGTYEVCHEMLGKPSVSLVLYGSRVYEAFASLKKCIPGSPDHVQALAAYHAAYLPDSLASNFSTTRSVVKFMSGMRAACEQVCMGLLCEKFSKDFDRFYEALKELQGLMLAPEYGMEALQNLHPEIYEKVVLKSEELAQLREEHDEALATERGSVKQANSKTEKNKGKKKDKDSVKKGKDKTKSSSGKKSAESDKKSKSKKPLKSDGGAPSNAVPHALFDKQTASGIAVMSKIVEVQPEWAHYFPFRGDLKERIAFRDYLGTAKVSAVGDWFPILRIVLNVDHDRPVVNLVYFSTTAALSFIQIIDNDTQKEVYQLIANIVIRPFVRNTLGYTYFAYGFCDNGRIKEHAYKLHIVSAEEGDLLHCCQGLNPATETCISAPPKPLIVKNVYGHYIPNRRNKVFRCILTVQCSQLLTIRASTNNPKADILVKITHDADENGDCELVYEKRFTGRATLPSLYFPVDEVEGENDQQPKVFLVEGKLATDDGWELSTSEQDLVVGIKERVQRELLVFQRQESTLKTTSETRRRSSSMIKTIPKSQEIVTDAAHWCVQVVVDADLEKTVSLELNRRKEQEIRKLKEEWERAEPGRHLRAMSERQKILEMRDEENRQLGTPFAKSKLFLSFQLKESCISPEQRSDWKIVAEDYGVQQEEIRREEREAFQEMMNEVVEKRTMICEEQKKTNGMIKKYLMEKVETSKAILEEGYRVRASCLANAAEKAGAKKGKKGGAAEKGSKKKKGGK